MEEPVLELRPGRFSDRFVAYLCDTLPFALGAVATVWVWGGPLQRPLPDVFLLADAAVWTGLAVLWQFAGNLGGGTLGHKLLGLRVATADGAAPGAGRSLVRALVWLLGSPLGNFGFWIALFHPRTRTLHDLVSGTFVVEDGPRRSDGVLAFIVAAAAAAGLFATSYMASLLTPSAADIAAVVRAQEGLGVIAQIQDEYRRTHETYAPDLQAIAEGSGDVDTFRKAMLGVFNPSPFYVEAGNRRWKVTAAAKDRRHTLVRAEGP